MAVRGTTACIYPASFLEGHCPLRHDGICALPPQHFDDLTMVCVITRLRKSRSDLSRHQDILPYARVWKGLCSVNTCAMHLLRCSPQALSCRCTPAVVITMDHAPWHRGPCWHKCERPIRSCGCNGCRVRVRSAMALSAAGGCDAA